MTDWTDHGDGVFTADLDGNLEPDAIALDLDVDGTADLFVSESGDGGFLGGVWDPETGEPLALDEISRDEALTVMPGVVEFLDPSEVDGGTEQAPLDVQPGGEEIDHPDVVVDGQLIGDPTGVADEWFQQARNGYCVPASITQIVARYTGIDHADESLFVEWTNELGLFVTDADGTPGVRFADAVQLFEKAGIPAQLEIGSPESLAEMLAEGRGVMLFVDSGEIWQGEATEDTAPDHAVVVTGIDVERGVVILSDPGHPEGNMEEVPIEVFEDAWADSNFAMIVCDQPAPDVLAADLSSAGASAAGSDQASVRPSALNDPAVELGIQDPSGWALLPVVLLRSALTVVR
jgi:hypothetical protein